MTRTRLIRAGVFEVSPTSTAVVPSTTVTVTVYSTTVLKSSVSRTTLTGVSTIVTKTAACAMLKCNADNCLRAMTHSAASASAFCSQYTTTTSLATPTYLSQCSGLASRVSSACTCLVTPTPKALARGVVQNIFAPPDFTYSESLAAVTVTETDPAPTTATSTVPSTTT